MNSPLRDSCLDQLFRDARTQNGWTPQTMADALIRDVYELLKLGPTSANCSPARFLFAVSKEAKEKLRPALSKGNVEKTMAAPVTAIVGYDLEFYELLPELFPHEPTAKSWFTISPMSGFDAAKVNAAFWPDGRIKVHLLCNIGYGDPSKVLERRPRLSFERACAII